MLDIVHRHIDQFLSVFDIVKFLGIVLGSTAFDCVDVDSFLNHVGMKLLALKDDLNI